METAVNWAIDIVVQDCGGLLENNSDWEGDMGLLHMINHVFDTNIELLCKGRPDLKTDEIDLLITAGTKQRAIAYEAGNARAIVLEIGLIRALWTRAACIAHIPTVLSNAFPIQDDVNQEWMAPECGTVPGMNEWDCTEERADYCVELFLHMLEYVVVHEIAHHVRDHIALVNNAHGLFLIDDLDARATATPEPSHVDGFLVQDLEFDADAHGLDLSIAAMDAKHPLKTEWDTEAAAEWQFQLVFAQLMVAQVFDDANKHEAEYTVDGHPAPLHRAINYSNLVSRSMHHLIGGPWDVYRDMHDTAWSEAGYVAKALNLPKGRWHNDHGKKMETGDFHALETRFFASSRRLDLMNDG